MWLVGKFILFGLLWCSFLRALFLWSLLFSLSLLFCLFFCSGFSCCGLVGFFLGLLSCCISFCGLCYRGLFSLSLSAFAIFSRLSLCSSSMTLPCLFLSYSLWLSLYLLAVLPSVRLFRPSTPSYLFLLYIFLFLPVFLPSVSFLACFCFFLLFHLPVSFLSSVLSAVLSAILSPILSPILCVVWFRIFAVSPLPYSVL